MKPNYELRDKVLEGAVARYGKIDGKIMERIDEELASIGRNHWSRYFLLWKDIADWARGEGILLGPGLSSDTASIVNFCLGITAIDPLQHRLFFEMLQNYGGVPGIMLNCEWGGEIKISEYVKNRYGESCGSLKLAILGLRVLSLIKETLGLIRERHNQEIPVDALPFDDAPALAIFAKGDTADIFHFNSIGMRKSLESLQPASFSGLTVMYALYRPGPMDVIPEFIARKKGEHPAEFDLPALSPILAETCGHIVYQEQIMEIGETVAGFNSSEADTLRRAIARNQMFVLDEMKTRFVFKGMKNGFDRKFLHRLWQEMCAQVHYAFSKAHAVSYTRIAYQCAWLKAHYPGEYAQALQGGLGSEIFRLQKFGSVIKKLFPDNRPTSP